MKTKIANGNIITTIENGDRIDDDHVYAGPAMVVSKSLPSGQAKMMESYKKKKKKRPSGSKKTSVEQGQSK